ncbi:TIGR03086 family protein [Saccharomonospora marina XMU15]|uniref:TIGR03086 family protein n=2 Tax=Saccharomonospora TaxID=1851 RepID=H5X210_9PSEU|nr:TIGR03086 family protein [Saccharomonospora marina XMU15]
MRMSELKEPISRAAREFAEIVRAVPADKLAAATPCEEYDVRGLCNHLLFWMPRLLAAAAKRPPEPLGEGERAAELVVGDWADLLAAEAVELAEALRDPAAWQGSTSIAGGDLPAAMVGRMALCELVVHGWDLATATGVPARYESGAAEAAEQVMREIGEQGRQLKAFGPEVPLGDDASVLDRVVALSGRDPAWRP